MEDDIIIDELEAEDIQNNNPIEDLVNSIQNKQYTDAEQAFNDIIGDRLQDKLDQAKMRIADTMYNAEQEVDDNDYDNESEEELTDNEFDDDIEEVEEDDDDYLNDIG